MGGPTNETGLVGSIVRAIHQQYPEVWGFKVHGGPMQVVGVPDLIFSVRGLFVAMEVKFQRPGESATHARERATPGQRAQIQKINDSGGIAAVVISKEEALDLIRRAFVKHEWMESHDEPRDHHDR
jgi:hypothetical protein